ncbi:MAG TPA: glycosyltransferase family 2 protein [Deltaproteobacteria bacterium]|nr:MAG: hypothetical protein A2Z79_01620 [Deltaproteobacteria bacterium GWA2_55_82]OGQ62019.1 MAG: hypothetical protein A3I81_03585 [Deltaproteobacteria bacterium RIFCSPLOWO2_02_FULL_55_12]OIJ74125.1 MAG: hypothetical protein A2V21_307530 [Deltaproteobacteria bacterium GWC2_55_46]HBG46739.1 glycosyltransferase family 2 protein [Deltaproteobacteria bacterium]HCY11252.1 glycosyltransferase family 2 protein [Deltaproteobacteria bacterium]
MSLKVYVVLLNWNGLKDTSECLESLEKAACPGLEIIVVDNGSTDGSLEALKKRFGAAVRFIENRTNLGFAGGCNAGLRQALSEGAEYVILLNNDTVVDADFARELLKAAETEPEAGIICSKIFFHDRPDVIWYAGAFFNERLGWGRHRGYNDSGDKYRSTEETGRPTGCSMMVTRELCGKIGLFDEEYFCYCEDLDWGLRARKAGFKVLFAPASKVWHKVSSSSGGRSTAVSLYYSTRNMLMCVDKNSPLSFPLRQLRYLSIAAASLLSLFTMGVPYAAGLKMVFKGFQDYFRGVKGELCLQKLYKGVA